MSNFLSTSLICRPFNNFPIIWPRVKSCGWSRQDFSKISKSSIDSSAFKFTFNDNCQCSPNPSNSLSRQLHVQIRNLQKYKTSYSIILNLCFDFVAIVTSVFNKWPPVQILSTVTCLNKQAGMKKWFKMKVVSKTIVQLYSYEFSNEYG